MAIIEAATGDHPQLTTRLLRSGTSSLCPLPSAADPLEAKTLEKTLAGDSPTLFQNVLKPDEAK